MGLQQGSVVDCQALWIHASGLGPELRDRQRHGTADLVPLHWLGDATLSIEEVGSLPHTLMWILHDQWAFCGAEHYSTPPGPGESESSDRRFELGYTPASRPAHERGPDLNRRTWLRKRRAWRRPMHIACPSTWLAGCVRPSALMGDWPVTVIPYPLDLQVWAPWDTTQALELLGLPPDPPLILFGADGDTRDPRKGADLRLRLLYAAADAFVIPSRQDNLPNTGLEAHACGTPVVPWPNPSMPRLSPKRSAGCCRIPSAAARQRAERLWHPARIAGMVAEVYRQAAAHARAVRTGVCRKA